MAFTSSRPAICSVAVTVNSSPATSGLAVGFRALQHRVGIAERVGESGIRKIVEAGCGKIRNSLNHGSRPWFGLGPS
ncbi:MAG TPA: hypothetical protein VJ783_23760, partial [Pirellulales bacterium]|nr:hypothetical protein [Pirellulales bacterium]